MGKSDFIGKKKAITKRKMKPYTKSGDEGKYYFDAEQTDEMSSNKRKSIKLEIKNSNRSLKKGVRQEGKNEIKNFLKNNDINNL